MAIIAFYWFLTLVPSLPLLLVYFAFRRVLVSKKFEMRMLLERGQALTKYLSAYGGPQQNAGVTGEKPRDELITSIVDQIFRLRYSTLEYVPAIAFSIAANALLMILALSFAGVCLGLPLQGNLTGNSYLRDVVAGGVGALIWGTYELCERYRSEDFPPDALFTLSARLLVLGAVGAVVGAVVNDRLAWPVAFALGVLPMSAVREYVAGRARKALHLPDPSTVKAKPPFTALQGWNDELSEKLTRAKIFSVQELACTNQFQLFLRSNLDWRVILDLSDQAMLILYIGEAVEKLRPLGIRSAVELAEINWSKDDPEFFGDLTHSQSIQSIASALKMDEQSVRLLIISLSGDATVNFIGALWSDDTPDDGDEKEDGEDATPAPDENNA